LNPLESLLKKHADASEELRGILYDSETNEKRESLTDDELARAETLSGEVDEFMTEIEKVSGEQRKQAVLAEARNHVTKSVAVDAKVVDEPRVYGIDERGVGSPNSYYRDKITIAHTDPYDIRHQLARERQLRWSDQVEREVANDSKFGRAAEKQLREQLREAPEQEGLRVLAEVRDRGRVARDIKDGTEARASVSAIASGGGPTVAATSGASSFVTPIFAAPYVPWREYGRAFADACFHAQLPDSGLAIYKPNVTGPAGVAQQTEANILSSGVTEVDPTVGYIVATLAIFAGEVTLSQVVIDRTSPDYRFDLMCEDQLRRDYDPKFDVYVLTQALANATSQSWAGGTSNVFELAPASGSLPGAGGFYGQIGKAKAAMRKLAGTVLNPNCLFLDPARYEYIAAWADLQGRPILVPDQNGPMNAMGNTGDGDAGIEGYTGTRLNGLPVYTDANLPTTGGTLARDQAVVGALNEVEVYEGSPVNRVLPQTYGANMATILQRYSYATVLVNYNAAVTSINGAAFGAITYVG
jgi:hypothetical protein